MLGRGDAVASAVERIFPREIGGVKLIEKLECGERVRTQEIDQMRGATDGGGFLGGDAAKAEIMQLEAEERRITGAHEGFANDLLDGARKCSNRDGIPNLDEKRFGPIGEPVELGVGVFDGDERVVCFDDSAFLDGADAQREVATVFGVEGFEAVVVEAFRMAGEVGVGNAAGFFDVVEREDLTGEVGFDDVLEHGQHGFFKHASAGFEVGIDVACIRGILPPVGEFIGVRVEDGIESQGLHGAPSGCRRKRGSIAQSFSGLRIAKNRKWWRMRKPTKSYSQKSRA